jgi:hypothetical protein
MSRLWITCPKCAHRNDRTGGRRKCAGCGAHLPKRRVAKHAEMLRDTPFPKWAALSVEIHGGELGNCAVCGRGPSENRNPDRDHDHRTGLPRGLACVRCNRELLRNSTLEEARAVVAYLERVEAFYARESVTQESVA